MYIAEVDSIKQNRDPSDHSSHEFYNDKIW